MNTHLVDTENAARALLDARIDSIRNLVIARQKHLDLQAETAEADRAHQRAYQAAQRDGWSADELKKLGLADKAPRARRRSSADSPAAS